MLIKQLMTHPVRTCHPATTAGEAAEAMTVAGVGCLPVVDEKNVLVGIITTSDFLKVAISLLPDGAN